MPKVGGVMKKLVTIQKRERLNDVYAVGEKGNGGAYHRYEVCREYIFDGEVITGGIQEILFQNGPRNEQGTQDGVLDTDLLEITRHRLECFQAGPFATDYNAKALEHIELALMYLNRRVEDRIERNVLGANNK